MILIDKFFKLLKHHYKRAIRSWMVGAIGAVESLTIQFVLVEFFGVWYISAAIAGTLFAMTTNYIGNYYWSFKDVIKVD